MVRRGSLLLVLLTVVGMLATPAAAASDPLQGPLFGLDTAPNGDQLVTDVTAGIVVVEEGVPGTTIRLPGATDVSAIGTRSMWATTSGEDAESDSGQALYRVSNGKTRMIANLFAFEAEEDPDGAGVDSNPFDVQSLGGNAALVVDAGGNDLLRVSNQGRVQLLATFPDELASTANLKALAGCPAGPPDFCSLPEEIPAQAVPTSVTIGPDGWYYVGELKGFPAPTDASNIWRVSPQADGSPCPNPYCEKVFAGGFTSIIDLAFGPDGQLYVAELDEQSWAALEIFGQGAGGTINSCDVVTKTCSEVASGIPQLTAISFGKDATLWHTRNSLTPGAGEVVAVP